jgi:hypothetical protein
VCGYLWDFACIFPLDFRIIFKSVTVVTVIAPALRAAFFSASLPQMSKSFLVAKKLLAGGLQPCP